MQAADTTTSAEMLEVGELRQVGGAGIGLEGNAGNEEAVVVAYNHKVGKTVVDSDPRKAAYPGSHMVGVLEAAFQIRFCFPPTQMHYLRILHEMG